MNEHDSLVRHALNNLSANELAQEYANIRMEYKRLQSRHEAAHRAMTKIATFKVGVFDETKLQSIIDIANDALAGWERT